MHDDPTPLIAGLVRERWPEARLIELAHLAGDFSARRYYRGRLAGGDAPATIVVMVLAGTGLPLSSEELGIFPEPPKELPFLDVHRLLTAIGAPVPAVHLAAVERGVLVLEDAGDTVLWDAVREARPQAIERVYQRALDTLVLIHERGTAYQPRTSIAFHQRFDERLLAWELEHYLEWGVERGLGVIVSPALRRGYEESFGAIARELAAAPPVLCHRDYHSWNVLWRDEKPVVIDFQDALLGPAEYDVASLLTDRITPERVDPTMESRLLHYYWTRRGRTADLDRRRYALVALHRALKVIGRVHYIALAKGKPGPLQFLPAAVATARRFFAEVDVPGALAPEFAALSWTAAGGAASA